MQYWLWKAASGLLRRLPVRAAYLLAATAGNAAFYLWPRGRRNMVENFRAVLPGATGPEIRRAARRSLAGYCEYLVEFARLPTMGRDAIVAAARGQEAFAGLDRVLAEGRGAIIVCMHYGNWDLGAAAAAARGYPLAVVAEEFTDPRLAREVAAAREALGMKVLVEGRAGPSLVRALRAKGLLALLIDRPLREGGVCVPFFGAPVRVPAGPARLALLTGARLVPVAFRRARTGRAVAVEVLAEYGIEGVEGLPEAEQVATLTHAVLQAHERFIRQQPEQWYMFRRMWHEGAG